MIRLSPRSHAAPPFRMAKPRTRPFEETPLGFVAMTAFLIGLCVLIVWGLPILAVAAGMSTP